tara:strand:- start:665 stop:1132 length:468 start_codon:yes stop_codon:yes gene_type:complete
MSGGAFFDDATAQGHCWAAHRLDNGDGEINCQIVYKVLEGARAGYRAHLEERIISAIRAAYQQAEALEHELIQEWYHDNSTRIQKIVRGLLVRLPNRVEHQRARYLAIGEAFLRLPQLPGEMGALIQSYCGPVEREIIYKGTTVHAGSSWNPLCC